MQVVDQLAVLFIHMALAIMIVFYVTGSLRDLYELKTVPSGSALITGIGTGRTDQIRYAEVPRFASPRADSVRVFLETYLRRALAAIILIATAHGSILLIYAAFLHVKLSDSKSVSDLLLLIHTVFFWISNLVLFFIIVSGFSHKLRGLRERDIMVRRLSSP